MDVTINKEEIDFGTSELMEIINDKISIIAENISLNYLKDIYVVDDVQIASDKLKIKHGIYVDTIEEKIGICDINLIYYKDEDTKLYNFILILDKYLVANLGQPNSRYYDASLFKFNKAIFFISECCKSADRGEELIIFSVDDGLNTALNTIGQYLWWEYISTRQAFKYVSNKNTLDLPFVLNTLKDQRHSSEIAKRVNAYNKDVEAFVSSIEVCSYIVLKASAKTLGTFHAAKELYDGAFLSEEKRFIDRRIIKSYFRELWLALDRELQATYDLYMTTGGIDVSSIGRVVFKTWLLFGIDPNYIGRINEKSKNESKLMF